MSDASEMQARDAATETVAQQVEATSPGDGPNETKRILVVGDWVVDEHWVTGVHRSPSASRTGRSHSRSLHHSDSAVQHLAGAGRAASLLWRAEESDESAAHFFDEVVCLGLWHSDDGDELTAMLDPEENKGQTPFRLRRRSSEKQPTRAKLINLNKQFASGENNECGTDRVIRVYQRSGAKVHLIHRIDWEMPAEDAEWHSLMRIPQSAAFDDILDTLPPEKEFSAIVVKDLLKGVVCKPMIEALAKRFPNKPWFVSTKAWRTDWLKVLKSVNLRAFLVPQVAAQSAIRGRELSTWITDSGEPSREALTILDDLANDFDRGNNLAIVVLPKGGSVVGRATIARSEAVTGFTQTDRLRSDMPIIFPMASVFFPSLILQIIDHELDGRCSDVERACRTALDFTCRWIDHESGRLTQPDAWNPSEPVLSGCTADASTTIGRWPPIAWDAAIEKWEEAFTRLGTIQKDGARLQIELWRAMTALDGYVCLVDTKRQVIQQIGSLLDRFSRNESRKHESCLVTSSPGTGKTFMIRQLADAFDLRFQSFNIAQLQRRDQILECFETILALQDKHPNDPLLVFVDEINAQLEGQFVYGSFLGPLEGGTFRRGGNLFKIRPCVWVFAGTQEIGPRGGLSGAIHTSSPPEAKGNRSQVGQ